MSKIQNSFFWFVFIAILSIGAVDLYLIIRFQQVIINEEKNPIGVWLIEMDNGSIALFSAAKMFGTCLSLMIWKKIFLSNAVKGFIVGSALLVFQLFLLYYIIWT
jgi:hypothetical protein